MTYLMLALAVGAFGMGPSPAGSGGIEVVPTAGSHGVATTLIPYFARKYGVTCGTCHVAPPKLNTFGREFLARGYEFPGREGRGATWPFAVWLSGRTERFPSEVRETMAAYVNRVEIVSGGRIVAPWLSYFLEWRPVSREARGDGTILDRSGRFEDLFLVAGADRFELMVGQFRQVAQVDVSQRISLSEPLVLSASLPGREAATERSSALRAFSPAGRSPAARLSWNQPVSDGVVWTTSLGVPLAGEFSIPLTSEARSTASNELEWRAKGAVVETFVRRGVATWGVHAFYGREGRYLANAVATGNIGMFYWTGMAGADRTGGETRGRWSAEAEVFPARLWGVGGRVENRTNDGQSPALLPYVNVHFPGTTYTMRLTVEQRIQRGRNRLVAELAAIF